MSVTFFSAFVKETSTTTGTGTYTLAGAVAGFRAFSSAMTDGQSVVYACKDNVNFEVGIGVYSSGTISRGRIISSSNSGSAVNWGAGTRNIFLTIPPGLFNAFSSKNAFDYTDDSNDISGNASLAVGIGNTVSGIEAMALGFLHYLSGDYSIGLGRQAASRLGNNLVYSNTKFYVSGDAQHQRAIGIQITSNATPDTLNVRMEPGAGTTGALFITARVLASQDSGAGVGDSKAWELKALVKYVAGTPTLIGSVSSTVIAASAGASAWTATLNFSNAYFVAVTGEAAKSIRWVADVSAVDVGY